MRLYKWPLILPSKVGKLECFHLFKRHNVGKYNCLKEIRRKHTKRERERERERELGEGGRDRERKRVGVGGIGEREGRGLE